VSEVAELTPAAPSAWWHCAAPCSISAASWCWKDCRNFSFGGGRPGHNRHGRRAEFSNGPLVAKAAKNAHKLRLFANFLASKGCRTGAPALPIADEIP